VDFKGKGHLLFLRESEAVYNMANEKFLIVVLSVFCWGCGSADDSLNKEFTGLKIRTVDESNQAFEVQTVRWWYSGEQDKKYTATCKADLCAEWVIEEELSAPIVIRVDTSIVKKDDKACWDLYTGEAVVDKVVREVLIVVAYVNTACTSQETIRR